MSSAVTIKMYEIETKIYKGPSTLYNAREGGRFDNLLYTLYGGWRGFISYCYYNATRFFHRDPTSWAIHECGESNKNGLLTNADINLAFFVIDL